MRGSAVELESEDVEAVVVADDVVEEPSLQDRVQVAVGVDDAGLVHQRRGDPLAVRPDHAGDAVVRSLGDVEGEPELGRDLGGAVLGGADREDLPLVGVGGDVKKELLARVAGSCDRSGWEVRNVDALALREQGVASERVEVFSAVEGSERPERRREHAEGGPVAAGPDDPLAPGRDELAMLPE